MNKYFFICLVFIVFTSCQNNPFAPKKDKTETGSNDQNNNGNSNNSSSAAINANLETLGEYIFDAIKKNDYTRFSKGILSVSNVKILFDQSNDPDKPANMEELMKGYNEQLTDIEEAFNDLHNDPDLWKTARYKETEYATTKKYNMETADMTIVFSNEGKENKIILTHNPKVNGRWYIMGIPKLDNNYLNEHGSREH